MTVVNKTSSRGFYFKGVAIDIDGTLLRSDHIISSAVKQSVRKIAERHLPVVLTSGRPTTSVLAIATQLDIDGFMVCLNGALVISTNGQIVQSDVLDSDVLSRLVLVIEAFEALTAHYFDEYQWLTLKNNESIRKEVQILGFAPKIISSMESVKNINKIMIVGNPEALQTLTAEVYKKGWPVTINLSKATHLEITGSGITKAVGLQLAAKKCGLMCKDFIAFGDGDNDVPLFEICGFGVAMGNASNNLKLMADAVIGTNDEDALATYIDDVLLQRQVA